MADPHGAIPKPELSPYQRLQNERIAAVATACHKANMRTAEFDDNACAGSVSAIVEKATGQKLREAIAPRMERGELTPKLQSTGHTDLRDPSKTRTEHVREGDLAFYSDSGKYFKPTGRVEQTHHVGIVTGTTAEGDVTHILSNASTDHKNKVPGSFRNDELRALNGDVSVQYYHLPATQESVYHMVKDVPRVGDKLELSGYTIVSLGRDGKPLPEKDIPKINVPDHDWTKPKDGWSMPDLAKGPDGSVKTPENQFKGITLQEAMFEAKHGKQFELEHNPNLPKLTPLQDETLKRAVLAHLPERDQHDYAAKMKLDGPTANEFSKPEYGQMPAASRAEVAGHMQLAIVHAKEGKTDISDFKSMPGGLAPEQAEKLNAMLYDAIEKHLPARLRQEYHQQHFPSQDGLSQPGASPAAPAAPTQAVPGPTQAVPGPAPAVPGGTVAPGQSTPTPGQSPPTPGDIPPLRDSQPATRRDGFVQTGTITDIKDGVVSQAVGRGKTERYALSDFSADAQPEVGKRMTVAYAEGAATAREPARELAQTHGR